MNESGGVSDECGEKQRMLREFQKSLGDTIVFLLELKGRRGVTQGDRNEINNTVEKLQQILRDIPDIVSDDSSKTVFGAIRKLVDLWFKLFSG